MERLSKENKALKAEVTALRARSDGTAEEAVQRAREQLASALRTLDGVLSPKPVINGCSSTQVAAANGSYGAAKQTTATNGCCPPSQAKNCGPPGCSTSTSSARLRQSPSDMPRENTTSTRPVPPRDAPSRLEHPPKDDECCGGLFDCDAMIRTAVGTDPSGPPP